MRCFLLFPSSTLVELTAIFRMKVYPPPFAVHLSLRCIAADHVSLYFLCFFLPVHAFMPNATIQINPLSPTFRHATWHKPMELPVVSCPPLSAQQKATALEMQDFFIAVAVPIQTGLHRIAQKIVWIVRDLCSNQFQQV